MLRTLRLTGTDAACLTACIACFTAWNVIATRTISWEIPAFFAAFCYACVLGGRPGVHLLSRRPGGTPDFPTSFLIGFFLISSALYLLALASPLGIRVNSAALLVGVVALGFRSSRGILRTTPDGPEIRINLYCIVAVALALVAVTLWSRASIYSVMIRDNKLIFNPWEDSFIHACHTRMFRDSHGASTLQNVRLAGEPPLFYHYAGYLVPAALAAWTATPTYLAVGSFAIPFGLFLNGLAAYALARCWWGDRAGIGAVVALLLLPDAPHHGLGNRMLGFHWLEVTSPSGELGVSIAALSWIFLMEGCRRRSLRLIAVGYLVAGLTITYKVHIFVAISVLACLYPPIFMRRLGRGWRAAWFAFALASFVAVVGASQRSDKLPVLRLDGSSLKEYMNMVLRSGEAGRIQGWLPRSFTSESSPLADVGAGAAILFFGTFGWFGVAYLAFAPFLRRKMRPAILLFPLLVMVNYLVMALGLALNHGGIDNLDELQHRPLVWAYFVVSTWVGGVASRGLLGGRGHRPKAWYVALTLAAFGLLAVPLVYGRDVHRGPNWGWLFIRQAVPRGLVDCSLFIRDHSERGDVIQDSGNDPDFKVSALSERQEFAIAAPRATPKVLLKRLDDLGSFQRLDTEEAVRAFASRNHIAWYLLRPDDQVRWPDAISCHATYQSNGYRVYSFKKTAESSGTASAWSGRLGVFRPAPPPESGVISP